MPSAIERGCRVNVYKRIYTKKTAIVAALGYDINQRPDTRLVISNGAENERAPDTPVGCARDEDRPYRSGRERVRQ